MDRQKQRNEQKSKHSEQTPFAGYSLEQLLAHSPQGAFALNAEGRHWLDGPLVEKDNG